MLAAACLLVAVGCNGCNKKSPPPHEPSEADGVPNMHEVLAVDVEEKILPPPGEEAPKPAEESVAPAAEPSPTAPVVVAPAAAPVAPAAPAVATVETRKPSPLQTAFNKKDVLAVVEESPTPPPAAPLTTAPPAASAPPPASPAPASPSPATEENSETRSVREAILAFGEAVEKADEKKFMDSIVFSPTDASFVKALWGVVHQMSGLEKDMEKAYGPAGLEAVRKNQQLRIGASIPSPRELAEELRITVSGNTAKVLLPRRPQQPMTLVKVDGRWKVQLFSAGQFQGPQGQMALTLMTGLTQGIQTARTRIGKPGYTPEKVMQEIQKALLPPGPGALPPGAGN